MTPASPGFKEVDLKYQLTLEAIKEPAAQFFDIVMIVSYLSFLPLFYGFQHLFDIIYASMTKRSINAYSFLGLLDLCIFVVFLANILITYAKNLAGTWQDFPFIKNKDRAMIYVRNYVGSPYIHEEALWVILIVIMWVRVFYYLRYNEYLGKFITVVERIVKEVCLIFIFYIIQLIFFALIAELCFRRNDNYSSAFVAFKTLFYASLGQFSFEDIAMSEKGPYFGITFMIIFLVCNIGIILNIFIAVIAVLYDNYAEHRNVYQMLETLKIRPQTEADKEYSSLISLPTPINVLHMFVAPFLLTSSRPQRVNECMLTIGYIPVMIGVTLVFAVYNLLLVPLAYVKLWWHKLIMIYVYSKSYRVSRADKFITFCLFWVFGLLTLTLSALADLYYFVRHLWLRDLLKTQHKSMHVQLSKRNIEKVRRYFLT